jgi:hypothetical protein
MHDFPPRPNHEPDRMKRWRRRDRRRNNVAIDPHRVAWGAHLKVARNTA